MNHFIHRDYTVMGSEVHLDIYDDRLAITSPGGMYSGQIVQDLPLEEISSDRRNPILADVMAQLDYMEKRGSGLKRICNETKVLDGYKEELKPVFKSTTSQFMTTIYSMEYEPKDQQIEHNQAGIKQGLSWEQVGTKMGLSWDVTFHISLLPFFAQLNTIQMYFLAFRIFFVPLQSNSKLQRQTDELSINGNDRRCCHEYDGDGAAEESDGEALGAWPSVRFGQSAVSAA